MVRNDASQDMDRVNQENIEMKQEIKSIINELEDKITTHNRLAIMYEGQEDDVTIDRHYTAAFAYGMALQIVRKHTHEERMLKLVK